MVPEPNLVRNRHKIKFKNQVQKSISWTRDFKNKTQIDEGEYGKFLLWSLILRPSDVFCDLNTKRNIYQLWRMRLSFCFCCERFSKFKPMCSTSVMIWYKIRIDLVLLLRWMLTWNWNYVLILTWYYTFDTRRLKLTLQFLGSH